MKTRRLRPSLFDVQVNGYGGVDFQKPRVSGDEVLSACRALRRDSTHRILLTLITDRIDSLEEKFAHLETLRAADPLIAETIAGYHLEGPYLSPEEGYRGAHPAEIMKAPDLKEFRRLQRAAGGLIKCVTVAPEWPRSERFIAAVSADGVVVSLGHTDADDERIDAAVRAGARMCTHLGNGCRAQVHRHNSIIQRLLARDDLIASFIPDGVHVPPATLKNFIRAKPRNRIILSGDPVLAAGAPPGEYIEYWCNRPVKVVSEPNGVVHLRGNRDYFAGSSGTLDKGVRNVARWTGLPLSTVWSWASRAPARLFRVRLPMIEAPF